MARRVSVIGAGTIGASWAAYFLARGFEVAAYDPLPNGEAFAGRFIDNAWPTLEKLKAVQPGADRKRFEFFKEPVAAVEGAEFVQESGPEREDLKIELFATLDAALPPETVIATSSSGLLISRVS
ncbi:MAG TPA: 3-hydroxyacyl-CoA dehydrogenase NAD-binding domain-containing protein, partial [Steroidobacteraceae bacterium]|nr:3-hydroxyacyl-CoA dehydrogenase NAD-binding domain-containing protein [Steroidobacteraceae bacterium]